MIYKTLHRKEKIKTCEPDKKLEVNSSSRNWFGPVNGYSLLDQMTSRNLNTSSVEYVNVL
jgi:hypothetical protein